MGLGDSNPDHGKPLRPPLRGRGALSNRDSRYHAQRVEPDAEAEPSGSPTTTAQPEPARRILSRNDSPDIPFERSINPYRGCEHGCVYCYARPTHAYLGLSPGLDFESRLFFKPNAAERLQAELASPRYRCSPIALGANTDPYQPIERQLTISRQVLVVLRDHRHPVTVTTKSWLIERDIDILADMAAQDLVQVNLSVTTLDPALARTLEPRAPAPSRRLETVRRLAAAGIPVRVLIAPVIPFLTDAELETIVKAAAEAGAFAADYILLRLPLEVRELFQEWLEAHVPLRAKHVMNRMIDAHGGRPYTASFGTRRSGTGVFADLIRQRFALTVRKSGLNLAEVRLDTSKFRPPAIKPHQLSLF